MSWQLTAGLTLTAEWQLGWQWYIYFIHIQSSKYVKKVYKYTFTTKITTEKCHCISSTEQDSAELKLFHFLHPVPNPDTGLSFLQSWIKLDQSLLTKTTYFRSLAIQKLATCQISTRSTNTCPIHGCYHPVFLTTLIQTDEDSLVFLLWSGWPTETLTYPDT